MFIKEFRKLLSYYKKHIIYFAKHDYQNVFLGILDDLSKYAGLEEFENNEIL